MFLKGLFIAVIGPSGVGKSTYIKFLKEKYNNIVFPVSITTRPKRKDEIEGISYYFVSKEEFFKKIKNNELLEYAFVHEKDYYGTLKSEIIDKLKESNILIKDIDYQGFLNLKKILPEKNFASIFILPPSIEYLIKRIKDRDNNITEEEINKRIKSIEKELKIVNKTDCSFKSIEGDIESSFKKFEDCFLKILKDKGFLETFLK